MPSHVTCLESAGCAVAWPAPCMPPHGRGAWRRETGLGHVCQSRRWNRLPQAGPSAAGTRGSGSEAGSPGWKCWRGWAPSASVARRRPPSRRVLPGLRCAHRLGSFRVHISSPKDTVSLPRARSSPELTPLLFKDPVSSAAPSEGQGSGFSVGLWRGHGRPLVSWMAWLFTIR